MKLVLSTDKGEHKYDFEPLDEYGRRVLSKAAPHGVEVGKMHGPSAEFDLCPPLGNVVNYPPAGGGKFEVYDDDGELYESGKYSETCMFLGCLTLYNIRVDAKEQTQ